MVGRGARTCFVVSKTSRFANKFAESLKSKKNDPSKDDMINFFLTAMAMCFAIGCWA